MSRNPRLLQYGSLIVLIVLVFAGGYYFFDKYAGGGLDPLEAIPEHSGAFIKVQQPGKLLRDLSENNEIWQGLLATQEPGSMLESLNLADSMLNAMGYAEFLDQGEIYIVLA
ncbi:MAG TPA: hypothetical protein VK994_02555, partial [Bacteroidales bacterium]|nr:hypothetical protein [Bacteroidales bacterium]